MTDSAKKKKAFVLTLALITLCGLTMRLVCCFWGYPLELHPDELTIVDSAIDMLRRHSWLAYVYNRPDQFEIKCNAALFSVASRILFRVPAYEAYESHYMAFIVIARAYTAIFGTAMIPLAGVLAGRMVREEKQRRTAQIVTACIFAFSPILVEHSAYATPDVVLTFLVLLFALLAQNYLETGARKALWLSVLVTGIAITVKYPAAILCIAIAAMVIRQSIREKRPGRIFTAGFACIGLLLLTVFLIAPNLFTDFGSAYRTFVNEARPNHLGADGLGWGGNLKYYLMTAVSELEPVSLVFVILGVVWSIRHRSERTRVLWIGPLYWICISVLSLHWVQWGIPAYVFYFLLAALGVSAALRTVAETQWTKVGKTLASGILLLLIGASGLNLVLSATATVKEKTIRDTRSISLQYCLDHQITTSNSIYEGYTPLSPNGGAGYRYYTFHLTDGKAAVNEPFATRQYFVTSGSYSGRYFAQPEKYPEQNEIYRAIEESFERIYDLRGEGNYVRKQLAVFNIPHSIRYLATKYESTGNGISIYDLAPDFVIVQSTAEPDCRLSADATMLTAGAEEQKWLLYERENGRVSLLCADNNLAVGLSEDGVSLCLVPAEDEKECEFELRTENGATALISDAGALSLKDHEIVLCPCDEGRTTQQWILISEQS